ncbi:MAG: hypothetical protein GX483_08115 [Actinomycetaceae bacterium]|nr:hypothetical protein [Actinomycetaceae bacterium]
MSETPRLSRRELRELGKLQARPADAESLTETSELTLRRPSRKELREARERALAEQAQSSPSLGEDVAALQQDESESGSASEAPAVDAGSVDTGQVAVSLDAPEEKTESPADDQPTGEAVQPDAPEPPVATERLTRRSVFDRFKSAPSPDVAEAPADEGGVAQVEDELEATVLDQESVASAEPEPAEVESMRQRLLAMTRRGRDEAVHSKTDIPPAVVDEEPAEDEPAVEEAADTVEPEADGEPVSVQRTSVMPDVTPEDDNLTALLAPTATTAAVPEAETDVVDNTHLAVEEDPSSGRRTFLNYALLLMIATLVGLLIGIWINNTFLDSGPRAVVDIASTTTELLL